MGLNLLTNLAQDFRYALRQSRKNLGFTCTALLMLALGIGSSVAIFAFVDAALIQPLPYPDPNRLVDVTESIAMFPRGNLSYPDYLDWKRLNNVFSSMDMYNSRGYLLKTTSGTESARGVRVSDGFFRTLGINPILGRNFYAGEDLPGAPQTVLLSYATWQNRYGSAADIVGRTVTLSGVATTIIGVLPRDFQFSLTGPTEFWTTFHASSECDLRRSCHGLYGVGRLRDGISVQTALAAMKTIAKQLEQQYPDSNRGQGASVLPLSEAMVGRVRPILLMLLSGAGLLLLISCINVSSLLLVRSESRRREMAVRGALGASRPRLIRQFATEGCVLVALGSVLGLLSASWTIRLLTKLASADMRDAMPYLQGLGLNAHSYAFAGIILLLSALLFSFTPSVRLPVSDLREQMAEGGRGSAGIAWRRLGSKLVVLELSLAVVLLVGAGLLGKSLYRLLQVDTGFRPSQLATLQVTAPPADYSRDEQAVALARNVVNRIASLPGVESVAVTSRLAMSGNGNTSWIRFLGRPYNGEHNEVNERQVSSGYFATLGAKLLRGRYFNDNEDASKPRVVIVNQALVRKYFADEDPLGKQYGDDALSPRSMRTIVGVIDDIREGSLDSENWPSEYRPFNQGPDTDFSVVARTSQAPQSLLPAMSAAIRQIDSGIVTRRGMTMEDRINSSMSAYTHRSSAWLVGAFAAIALLLSAIGLYGVVAYSVSQRTREIGVRIALGADSGSVCQLILKEAAALTAVGLVIGLPCSLAAVSLIRGLLFGVQSWDVPTLAAVSAVLGGSALLASYLPARRAASVNPVDALRAD